MNYRPCWQGKDPSKKIKCARLQRPPMVPKGSKNGAIMHPHYWLSSEEIDFASYLLATKCPHMDGFQSTLLFGALHNGGIVGTPSGTFIQIVHTGGNHWLTVSNLFCESNQICVYDSLSTVLDEKDKQILSWLIRPVDDKFMIIYPAVQQQSNSSNCGLFAVAFAFVLSRNLKPENCQFREGRLRTELLTSFRCGRVRFKLEPRHSIGALRETTVDVHCVCRTAHYRELMVECSLCKRWYHPNCVQIPQNAITKDDEWYCPKCKEKI